MFRRMGKELSVGLSEIKEQVREDFKALAENGVKLPMTRVKQVKSNMWPKESYTWMAM